MRHAARRDGNDAIITEALRKAGFTVTDLRSLPGDFVVLPIGASARIGLTIVRAAFRVAMLRRRL